MKAIVAGPAVMRAYPQSRGGAVFVTPAVSGTDEDCARASTTGVPLVLEETATVRVGVGEVACLSTGADRRYELLWRARVPVQSATPTMAWTAR